MDLSVAVARIDGYATLNRTRNAGAEFAATVFFCLA